MASMLIGVFLMCSMSPTFILGIWHGGDWLKRDLSQLIYGRVECGSPISSWFIAFINEKFTPLIFMCKCTHVYMDFDSYYVYGIYVPIMLFICICCGSIYVWFSVCFYLFMNG